MNCMSFALLYQTLQGFNRLGAMKCGILSASNTLLFAQLQTKVCSREIRSDQHFTLVEIYAHHMSEHW